MQAESGRPNRRKPEGRILVNIRPNRKAEFDRKAENIRSIINAYYVKVVKYSCRISLQYNSPNLRILTSLTAVVKL